MKRLVLFILLMLAQPAWAQSLVVADRQTSRKIDARDLLADPATRDVTIVDRVFKRPMTYRAIAMSELLKGLRLEADDYLQARATDNFSIAIPGRLLRASDGGIEAFLAIEPPGKPWPNIPGKKDKKAGPFYIVWRTAQPDAVSSEYWAYQLGGIAVVDSPIKRWAKLAVGDDVPAADPIRHGLEKFVEVCFACHRFGGDGEATMGPDLGQPMNPVDYLQLPALKKLIRDPASVRVLAEQKMPAFTPEALSDGDIDAIVAWLAYKAR